MLKKRALRRVEDRRRKQLRATTGTIGLHLGYDNNVNFDSDRRGDLYCEQYVSIAWVPTFSDYYGAQLGTWYYSDWYFDNRDTTITDNAFNASLKWYPRGNPSLELQPGLERSYAYYPFNTTSTFVEDRAFLKFAHRFWRRWSQDGRYEYAFKEYDTKGTRRSDQTYIPGMVLEKTRQSFYYDLGFPFGKNNLKIKQRVYKETSNDDYLEFFDVNSYKVTAEIGRGITKKLYGKLSHAYERKNYTDRTVTVSQMAQYDDVHTRKLNLYYSLKKGWTLSYTLTHRKSNSNNAIYDYDSLSHLAGLYISF